MTSRRILMYLVIILLLAVAARPRAAWQEAQRIWSQRNYIMAVLVTAIGVYLIYGFYQLYRSGYFVW